VKPFYLSNRSTFQTQLVPLHRAGGGSLPGAIDWLPGAIDWGVAGFDRFGAVGSSGGYDEGGNGNFLGKLGQGLGLGKGALGWA
jgi:hypothetical protein